MNLARSTIWRVPAYLPYIQAPLSPEMIEVAQKQLGVTLPMHYLELLAEQNGGYVRRAIPNSPHSRMPTLAQVLLIYGLPSLSADMYQESRILSAATTTGLWLSSQYDEFLEPAAPAPLVALL